MANAARATEAGEEKTPTG